MSLESGRKFGYYASLINVILPIVSVVSVVAIIVSIIAASATRIANSTVGPVFSVFGGLIIFLIFIGGTNIVAYFMFFYSMYSLSNYYKEPAIFKNILYAFIVSIISVGVVFTLEFGVIISAIAGISPTNTPSAVTPSFMQIILTYTVVFVAALAFAIVNGLLYMRAFNKLGEKSGVDNFKTAAILYIIGAIIPLVTWIAWIFSTMAFNKLKQSLPVT